MPEGKRRRPPRNCFWRGPILWGRVEVRGHEHKFSLRTSDAGTAKRRVETELKRLVAAAHFGEHRHAYDDVFVEWKAHISMQVGPNTAKRYATSLRQLEPELKPKFIDEIDKSLIVAMIKRRRDDGASTATIRRDLTALSSVLEYAEDQDYREGNPALDRLRKLKERRNPIVLPELAHIERVAQRAGPMMAALIRAALSTGCRQNEMVMAERRNFDAVRRQLTVRGKRNKIRTVELDDATVKMLAALPVCLGSPYLFWHHDGEPFRSVSVRFRNLVAAVARSAQKAAQQHRLKEPDFRAFTFHHLRHRHAVDWLKSGRSIYDLSKRLGHTSIKTTEIYLAYLTPDEARLVKGESAQKPEQGQRFSVVSS